MITGSIPTEQDSSHTVFRTAYSIIVAPGANCNRVGIKAPIKDDMVIAGIDVRLWPSSHLVRGDKLRRIALFSACIPTTRPTHQFFKNSHQLPRQKKYNNQT